MTVDELVIVVNVALGSSSLQRCTPCDANGDSQSSINEVVGAVDCALNGCPSQRTPEVRTRRRGEPMTTTVDVRGDET